MQIRFHDAFGVRHPQGKSGPTVDFCYMYLDRDRAVFCFVFLAVACTVRAMGTVASAVGAHQRQHTESDGALRSTSTIVAR